MERYLAALDAYVEYKCAYPELNYIQSIELNRLRDKMAVELLLLIKRNNGN